MRIVTRKLITLAAVLAVPLMASPALAQRAKAPTDVTITNARGEPLTGLVIQTTENTPRVVGTLTKALAPGKTQKLVLKKPKGCTYNVLARFADDSEAEAEGVDLCKDKVIRLTE